MAENPFNIVKNMNTPIVKAEKRLHKGFMFGHISNGGGSIDLGDGFVLKIIAENETFITIQLLDFGKKLPIRTQTWQKSKLINKKKVEQVKIQTECKQEATEDLF